MSYNSIPTDLNTVIIKIVTDAGAIKELDLTLRVMEIINPTKFNSQEYFKHLETLVEKGRIIRIEYTIPEVNYKSKSFYLLADARLEITKN